MTHLDYLYDLCRVVYGVHHPVIALANTVPTRGTGQLLTAGGTRLLRERLDSSKDALAIPLGTNRIDLIGGRRLDEQPILGHAASNL